MVESFVEYKKLISDLGSSGNPLILSVIPSDSNVHPAKSKPSIVFIRDIKGKKTHSISFGHKDLPSVVPCVELITDLNVMTNKKFVFDKKSFIQIFPIHEAYDVNLLMHLRLGKMPETERLETLAHKFINRSLNHFNNLNDVIPLLKHKEMFDNMCDEFLNSAECFATPLDEGYLKENKVIIETLAELERNGIFVNTECFNKHHPDIKVDGILHSQYNIYTSTGRPSNHFDNVNYAALNKENGVRKCFVSRFGEKGKMVLIDYSAFHPRIICHLIKFPLAIDVDIYRYLGEMYFGRELTEYDIDEAKKLTFRQLYGGVEDQYAHIKYLAHLKEFINSNWSHFQQHGYVLTPIFKRQITNKHLVDANPNKLFNYILQATETEIAIPAVNVVNQYLRDKQTKAVLYTYDSILFDFHKDDGGSVLNDIMTIMKMGDRFPIKVYLGDSYDSVAQIYP